jgi:nucleoside-diphosphate-sugar epimerase
MEAKILVTGATGFIGRALFEHLRGENFDVLGSVRVTAALERGFIRAPELSATSGWREVLAGRDVVVHTAARAHVLKETEQDPLAVFRMVNTAGTLNLARQAAAVGVRRFVFISSIGVNGLLTREGECFSEQSPPAPHNHYALSKREAEQGLLEIARETGMDVVIVRPPLVYGPDVDGNFLRLLQLVERGIPLPLAWVDNRRSMIYLGNFVDALTACASHPDAAGKTFLVGDGEDISTPQLIRDLARLMGKPSYLWPFPPALLRLAGRLGGKSDEVERLLGSLVIDSSKIRRELGWAPPFSMEQGLAETARWQMRGGRA